MKTFMCLQTSPAWWQVRRGVPTASNFDRILQPTTGKPSKSQTKYICELVAQIADLNPNYFSGRGRPVTQAMQHGIDNEPEARRWLEMELDVSVQQVGFCCTDDGKAGCSPDGLIGADGGAEIKCVQLETQAAYLLDPDALLNDYKCQVHGSLIVTGRKWWKLLSYAPGLDPLVLHVEPDKFTERLREELASFNLVYDAAIQRFGLTRPYPTLPEEDRPDPQYAAPVPTVGVGDPREEPIGPFADGTPTF